MVTRVENSQAQQTTQPKAKAQPQKQENIVIEFTSLPKELRTEEVRKFYDLDNNCFLESRNENGENEIALITTFAKSKGIDLNKYASKQIVRVKNGTSGAGEYEARCATAYDKNDNFIKCYDQCKKTSNGTPYGSYENTIEEYYDGGNHDWAVKVYDKDMNIMFDTSYAFETLMTGGSYEWLSGGMVKVTTPNGEVKYLSLDGKFLEPEHVRQKLEEESEEKSVVDKFINWLKSFK